MRHGKRRSKLGRTSSHRRCLMANQLKSLIVHEQIETSLAKAKVLRQYADKMITLAKKGDLASRRRAIAKMMIRFNKLTPKQARAAKSGDTSSYNNDRLVMPKLFTELADRFKDREGGYTQIIKTGFQVGDCSEKCVIKFLDQ